MFAFHKIRLPLSHVHYDRFDTPDDEEDGKWSVNVLRNVSGQVDRAEMPVDGAVIVFKRRPLTALSSVAAPRQQSGK